MIVEMIKRLDGLNDRVERPAALRQAANAAPGPGAASVGSREQRQLAAQGPGDGGRAGHRGGRDVPAIGDLELLHEVFLNLLLNAGQAMEGRGVVSVTVEKGAMALVGIHDQGPGIPVALQAKLFEPFFTTKRSGTGLGLAIVRRLVELQHGTVTIESSTTGGTTVLVTLPLDVSLPSARDVSSRP